jgi:hypothetical protein
MTFSEAVLSILNELNRSKKNVKREKIKVIPLISMFGLQVLFKIPPLVRVPVRA